MRDNEILEGAIQADEHGASGNPSEIGETRYDDWFDDEEPLTAREKELLEARLGAYAKNPEAGSTWEEVEGRIRARLNRQPSEHL